MKIDVLPGKTYSMTVVIRDNLSKSGPISFPAASKACAGEDGQYSLISVLDMANDSRK